MSAGRPALALASAILLAAIQAQAAAGAPSARQSAELQFLTTEPGSPSAARFTAEWRDPDDPEGKPHTVRRLVSRMPEGFVHDTGAIDQCHASDQELTARGAEACPPGSVLSRGTAVTDAGPGSPFPRFMTFSLTMFNSDDEYLSLAELMEPPFQPFRIVAHNAIRGNTVVSDFPAFPGGGPPDGYVALRSMRVQAEPRVREGRAWGRMPPTCPPSGVWTSTLEFVYQDERSETVVQRSPCRRAPGSGAIALRVTPRHVHAGRRTRFAIRASVARRPVAGALVRILGRRAPTDAKGRATLVATPRRPGLVKATATKPPLRSGRKSVRVLPPR